MTKRERNDTYREVRKTIRQAEMEIYDDEHLMILSGSLQFTLMYCDYIKHHCLYCLWINYLNLNMLVVTANVLFYTLCVTPP